MAHSSISRQQELWAETVAEKKSLAVSMEAHRILAVDSFDDLQSSLSILRTKYVSLKTAAFLSRMNPVFERLLALSHAISVFVQSNPTNASLVWGSILVLLECASRFSTILGRITGMMTDMMKAMPRFDQYFHLYPKSAGLQASLRDIYRSYVDFCIHTINFLQHKPIYHIVNLLWSRVVSRFDSAIKEIEASKREFEAEARLAHDIVAAEHRNIVENALPAIAQRRKEAQTCFSVPFHRNHNFFGRQQDLAYLHQVLKTSDQGSCTIHGSGGLGKTQLALEYAYSHVPSGNPNDEYKYVFWISAQNVASLAQGFSDIPRLLGLEPEVSMDNRQVEVAHRWLCNKTGWLLIFDTAESTPSLNAYWPACAHGAILITTQVEEFCHRTRANLNLRPFPPDSGAIMLLKFLNTAATPQNLIDAEAISSEVDGLPLLLVGLAGYIRQSHLSLKYILDTFRGPRGYTRRILANESTTSINFQYERPIFLVYDLALRALPTDARNTLNIMSMLSPDSVPESILMMDPRISTSPGSGMMRQIFIDEVRSPLGERNLVTIQNSSERAEYCEYSMHRTLQRILLDELDQNVDTRQQVFDQSVALVRFHLPKPSPFMIPLYDLWPMYAPLLPHVVSLHSVFEKSTPSLDGNLQFAELLCNAGAYLYEKRLGSIGLPMLKTAENICKAFSSLSDDAIQIAFANFSYETTSANGPDSNSNYLTASDLATLEANILAYAAGIHWSTGGISTRNQAHAWSQRIIDLREKHMQDTPSQKLALADHLLLANSYSDFGYQMFDEGAYLEAEPWFEKSLEVKKECRLNGEQVPNYEFAGPIFCLAIVRQTQGMDDEAMKLAEEAITMLVDEYGREDVSITVDYRFWKANLLFLAGEVLQSLSLHQQVLSERKKLTGEFSSETMDSHFAIGVMHYHLGDFENAESSIRTGIDNQEKSSWPSESRIRANYYLSMILRARGDHLQAKELAEKAVKERNHILLEHAADHQPSKTDQESLRAFDMLVNHCAGRFVLRVSPKVRYKVPAEFETRYHQTSPSDP